MACGLFATLIIGVIIEQLGKLLLQTSLDGLGNYVLVLSTILKSFMGVGIGVGIAYSLKQDGFFILWVISYLVY